jgi:hypothetical protein
MLKKQKSRIALQRQGGFSQGCADQKTTQDASRHARISFREKCG